MRRDDAEKMRVLMKTISKRDRGTGKPKKKWIDDVESDIRLSGVSEQDVGDLESRKC